MEPKVIAKGDAVMASPKKSMPIRLPIDLCESNSEGFLCNNAPLMGYGGFIIPCPMGVVGD